MRSTLTMWRVFILLAAVGAVGAAFMGCAGSGGGCPSGTEGCPCAPSNVCELGSRCVRGVCETTATPRTDRDTDRTDAADLEADTPDGDTTTEAEGDVADVVERDFEGDRWLDRGDGTVIDQVTGVLWAFEGTPVVETPLGLRGLSFRDANDYCAAQNYGGISGWRLPRIHELRSLIVGCPGTELGGTCGVSDQCLDPSACLAGCISCESSKGPGKKGGYVQPGGWPEGDDLVFGSATPVRGQGDKRWWVIFPRAEVVVAPDSAQILHTWRCIHDALP